MEKYVEIFAIVNHFQSYNLDFAPQYDVVRENWKKNSTNFTVCGNASHWLILQQKRSLERKTIRKFLWGHFKTIFMIECNLSFINNELLLRLSLSNQINPNKSENFIILITTPYSKAISHV